jgi:hypothetical protein
MKKPKKNFFYLDELDSSSEEFEDEYLSFSDPRVVGIKTMKQPKRGSIYKEPTAFNPYAKAYLGQQHSDPGRHKNKGQQHSDPGRLKFKDQQHSDPGRYKNNDQQHLDPDQNYKTSWLNKLCCCYTKEDSVKTDHPVEFITRTRLQRKPSFRYPK